MVSATEDKEDMWQPCVRSDILLAVVTMVMICGRGQISSLSSCIRLEIPFWL